MVVHDKQITYKLRDLQGNQLASAYYYLELSKTVFPHKFKIVDDITTVRQFTDNLDANRTKYRLIKAAECQTPVWLPEMLLWERSAEDKRTKTISSAVFMHWLNSDD